MDVREKLVELFGRCTVEESITIEPVAESRLVDFIVNHGVTVQEWIPASEPPKKYRDEYGELIPFLVCEEGTDYPFRAMYDGKTWGDGIFAIPVKWWMRIPAPPKGKEQKDGDGNV